ncbi:hypothetical protein RFI_34972, partial [Reticulomyxa filosa]
MWLDFTFEQFKKVHKHEIQTVTVDSSSSFICVKIIYLFYIDSQNQSKSIFLFVIILCLVYTLTLLLFHFLKKNKEAKESKGLEKLNFMKWNQLTVKHINIKIKSNTFLVNFFDALNKYDNKKEQQRGLEKSGTKTNTKKIRRAERIDDAYVFPDKEKENKKEVAPNESNKEQEVLTQQKMKNLNLNKHKLFFASSSNPDRRAFVDYKYLTQRKKKIFCILLLWLCLVLFFLFPVTYKKALENKATTALDPTSSKKKKYKILAHNGKKNVIHVNSKTTKSCKNPTDKIFKRKKHIADARRAKQNKKKETNEKVLVNETSRPKEKNKQTSENIYTNKTSEQKKIEMDKFIRLF